jgi:hypothetical protein
VQFAGEVLAACASVAIGEKGKEIALAALAASRRALALHDNPAQVFAVVGVLYSHCFISTLISFG